MYIISKLNKSVNQKGSSLSLPAHPSSRTLCVHYGAGGRVGARATPFITALFAKQKTKFGGGGKALLRLSASDGQARAGKNSFPPTPFLFARPNVQISAPPKAEQSVRILFKKGSSFVQQLRPFDSLSFAQGLRPNESKGSELAEGPTQKF